MTPDQALTFVKTAGERIQRLVKENRQKHEAIHTQMVALDSELAKLQKECPHDITEHIHRRCAEEDNTDVCQRCGAIL